MNIFTNLWICPQNYPIKKNKSYKQKKLHNKFKIRFVHAIHEIKQQLQYSIFHNLFFNNNNNNTTKSK